MDNILCEFVEGMPLSVYIVQGGYIDSHFYSDIDTQTEWRTVTEGRVSEHSSRFNHTFLGCEITLGYCNDINN